jgi:basic membrane protein A
MRELRAHARGTFAAFSVALILGLAGCGAKGDGGKTPLRLGLVTSVGGFGDRGINDSAFAGLAASKTRFGAEIQTLESKNDGDLQANLTLLADEGMDEILAVGYPFGPAVSRIARYFPKRHFALIDAVVPEPNVASIVFREQEGAFLAGALAASVSKTHHVAFLGGADVPLEEKYEAGFAAGARQVDPAATVSAAFVGSFEDEGAARKQAAALYDARADVLFVDAGKAAFGAFAETRARPHVYAIGSVTDQDALVPGKILTSVLKHVDVAVFQITLDAVSQKLPGGPRELGLKNGGIGLTGFKYTRGLVGAATLAYLDRLQAAIIAGKIVPPATRAELAAFKRVNL